VHHDKLHSEIMNFEVFMAVVESALVVGTLLIVGVIIWYRSKLNTKHKEKLKCSSCSYDSCVVVTQNQLQHVTTKSLEKSGNVGPNQTAIMPGGFEDRIIGDQDKYCYCNKCGFYEKL
jgi:hypothetical protein